MDSDWEAYKVTGLVEPAETEHWAIETFTTSERGLLAANRGLDEGDEQYVMPGTYTRLRLKSGIDPMMSDTRMEILSHMDFIEQAYGRVLINGLGLGMVLRAVLKQPEVTHVDVVECDAEVISMIGPAFEGNDRVTIHHADAFTVSWPEVPVDGGLRPMHWDCVWHDIWPDISTDDLVEHEMLRLKYENRATHQRAWQHDFLIEQQAEDAEFLEELEGLIEYTHMAAKLAMKEEANRE